MNNRTHITLASLVAVLFAVVVGCAAFAAATEGWNVWHTAFYGVLIPLNGYNVVKVVRDYGEMRYIQGAEDERRGLAATLSGNQTPRR